MSATDALPFCVIIPARHASARLPGKPLLDLCGKPMIRWVWERARASGASLVIVATDDARIVDACRAFGADVELTSARHVSGTDRLAEVVVRRGFPDDHIVVNLQGDEPLIQPRSIAELAQALQVHADCDIATPVTAFESLEQWRDPNCVKAVRNLQGRALYFSRAPIPWPRDADAQTLPAQAWRHIGLYAYRTHALRRFAALPPSRLEEIEKLEQLRALEHDMRIHLHDMATAPPPGVDTVEDVRRVRAELESRRNDARREM